MLGTRTWRRGPLVRWVSVAALTLATIAAPGCGNKGNTTTGTIPATNIPELVAKLKETKGPNAWNARNFAATRLGRMGPAAAEAIPELERLAAKDPNPTVRKTAAEALEKIRGGK